MPTKYELIFQAVDRFSGVANQVDSKLGSIFGKVDKIGGSFTGLGVTGGAALAGLLGGALALGAAFVAINASINTLNNQLEQSVKLQSDQALAAINVANTANKSIEQADQIVDSVTKAVAEKTAPLPGLTQKYVDIALVSLDNITAFAKNQDEINNYATKISTLFGVYGGDLSSKQLKDVVSDVTSGQRSLNQIGNREFFVNNPALFRRFKEQLEKIGITETKGADPDKIFKALTNIAPTDAEIRRMQNTFQGKIDTLLSGLLDPTTGILGFSKQIAGRGNRRVIDAATDVLTEVMDIFGQIGNIFNRAGFGADSALEFIYDSLGRFADFLQSIQDNLKQNEKLYSRGLKDASDIANFLGKLLGFLFNMTNFLVRYVGAVIGSFYDLANTLIDAWNSIPDQIAKFGEYLREKFFGWIDGAKRVVDRAFGNPNQSDPGNPNNQTSNNNQPKSLIDFIFGKPTIELTGAKYTGQIPLKSLDFMRAEANHNPGQKQVIASENEFILTPSQMKNLVSNIYQNATPVFNVTVNAGLGAQEIANTVVSTIQSEWNQTKLSMFDLADVSDM